MPPDPVLSSPPPSPRGCRMIVGGEPAPAAKNGLPCRGARGRTRGVARRLKPVVCRGAGGDCGTCVRAHHGGVHVQAPGSCREAQSSASATQRPAFAARHRGLAAGVSPWLCQPKLVVIGSTLRTWYIHARALDSRADLLRDRWGKGEGRVRRRRIDPTFAGKGSSFDLACGSTGGTPFTQAAVRVSSREC